MRTSLGCLIVAGLTLGSGLAAHAQDEEQPRRHIGFFERYHLNRAGKPPVGRPRSFEQSDERAGYPRQRRDHLEPSRTIGGVGYYVGGGVPIGHRHFYPFHARRRRDEGTWGWDETGGPFFGHRNILGWSHGRRYQDGVGAYRTDGPVVPDLIYATTAAIDSIGRRENGEEHEEE